MLTAIVLTTFGMSLEDPGEAIFEGITMLIAAGILTWMIFWMGKQARFLKSELEAGVNKAAAAAGKSAVFWLAFVAVVREGVELALFITAAFFAGKQGGVTSDIVQTLVGTILGVGTAALLSWTLFAYHGPTGLAPLLPGDRFPAYFVCRRAFRPWHSRVQ